MDALTILSQSDQDDLRNRINAMQAELDALKLSFLQVSNLGEITNDLGDVHAGRFRTGSLVIDDQGGAHTGTGAFMGDPATFGGVDYDFGGVNNGVLQFGARIADGKMMAGAGNVTIDEDGIKIAEGTAGGKPGQYFPNSITFVDGSGNSWSDLTAYRSGATGYHYVKVRCQVASDATKKAYTELSVLDTTGNLIYSVQIDGSSGIKLVGPTNTIMTLTDALANIQQQLDYPYIGARAYKNSGAQSINNATATAISLDAETNDSDAFHNNATNNSRLTVPTGKAGLYAISGVVQFASNAAGYRQLQIQLNGATILSSFVVAPTTTVTSVLGETKYYLNDGDYIELLAYQNSGGALNVNAGAGNTWFSMVRVGK